MKRYTSKNMTDYIHTIVYPQEVIKNSYVKMFIVRGYKQFYRLTRPKKTRGIRFDIYDRE